MHNQTKIATNKNNKQTQTQKTHTKKHKNKTNRKCKFLHFRLVGCVIILSL